MGLKNPLRLSLNLSLTLLEPCFAHEVCLHKKDESSFVLFFSFWGHSRQSLPMLTQMSSATVVSFPTAFLAMFM